MQGSVYMDGHKGLDRVEKILVDGHDYTRVCYEYDDTAGYAMCYKWTGYPNKPLPADKIVSPRQPVKVNGRVDVKFKPVAETSGNP